MVVSTSIIAKGKFKFDDFIATLLSEEMCKKHQESSFGDALIAMSTNNGGRSH